VVLLELKFLKVNGLEVLLRIESKEGTRMIPVVVLSSSKEQRDLVESYQQGVNNHIVKPADFDKSADAVSNLGIY